MIQSHFLAEAQAAIEAEFGFQFTWDELYERLHRVSILNFYEGFCHSWYTPECPQQQYDSYGKGV